MIRYISVAALLAVGATLAYAQGAGGAKALDDRKAIMKAQLAAARDLTGMAKGTGPFDLAKVQAALQSFQEGTTKFKGLFPDDSKTGETRATPAVWTDRADFNKKADEFVATAKAAAAKIKDEASFRAEFPAVSKGCDNCHEKYRAAAKK